MAQYLSIESGNAVHIVTRTQNSRLWFVKNPQLDYAIRAQIAKWAEKYKVKVHSFKLMGNHYHLIAVFPFHNKALFVQALNSSIARMTGELVTSFEVGRLWGRRASCQILPNNEDIEHYFFYCALNAVSSGLVTRISDDELYNSFSDAISGRSQTYRIFRKNAYNNARRSNPRVARKDFYETYTLKYERLPGYEDLSQEEYKARMLAELERRRLLAIKARQDQGLGFASAQQRKSLRAGARPVRTKTNTTGGKRPFCLSLCARTRRQVMEWYYAIRDAYRIASERFRSGDLSVEFPPGTYRPVSYTARSP